MIESIPLFILGVLTGISFVLGPAAFFIARKSQKRLDLIEQKISLLRNSRCD